MNIAVISPHSVNNGNTTVAGLVALELGARGKKVCLTHTHTKSPCIFRYFGLDDEEQDKTANPARMVKMIREGILKRENITEYCRPITQTVEIYSANDAQFNHDDMIFALEFIIRSFPHDFVVFDVDINEMDSDANKIVLGNCDFVIFVMEQNVKEVASFREKFRGIWKSIGKKPMLMVVNKYNPAVGKVNDLALQLGIKEIKKSSSWLYLRYNPYIIKYSNKGDLQGLHRAMRTNDARIIDISSDIKNIVNRIMKFRSAKRMGYGEKEEIPADEDTDGTNTEASGAEGNSKVKLGNKD